MKKIFLLLIFSVFIMHAQEKSNEKDSIIKKLNERFIVKNLAINNEYSSFGTTFYGKNKVVYSARNEKKANLDLYQGTIAKDGEIVNPTKIKSVSSKSFESNVAFTKDGKYVYFTRSKYGKSNTKKVYKDKRATIAILKATIASNGDWKNIVELPFNSKFYDVGHPALNADDTKLFFTSNMPGTKGSTDIFYVDILGAGNYSKPENMGEIVNSTYKEAYPHFQDGALYFSSYRKGDSYGKADIYAVKLYDDGKVSDRIHLSPPINSIADDFSYIFNHEKKQGYFSSNRNRGKGADDIYSFNETRPLVFDCYQDIDGEVIDLTTGRPVTFAKVVLYDSFDKEIETITTEKDGKFLFKHVICSANYEIKATKKHYGLKSKGFVTLARHNGVTKITIPLSDDFIVMKRGKKMLNIFNIHFEYDSSKITKRAAGQLNMIVATMRRYPRMVIKLGAHTDARGGDAYNLKLSNARAQSTINYIINKGEIASERISGKGYGETRLLNHCDNANKSKCTKLEHEINRRSEFIITRM